MRVRVTAAAQTPNLLTFFIASTAWHATSFGLLRLGGAAHLAAGSALLLPVTILFFIRPVPLPYSWAAAPEPLSPDHARCGAALLLALCAYHSASFASLWARGVAGSGRSISRPTSLDAQRRERQERRSRDSDSPTAPYEQARL